MRTQRQKSLNLKCLQADGISEDDYVTMREEEDAALEMRSIEHRISEAIAESSSNSIEGDDLKRQRWDLNSKFQMENFIRRQNDLLLLSRRKSVRVTTRRPNKNNVIISTHKNKYNNDKLVINMPWMGTTGVVTIK